MRQERYRARAANLIIDHSGSGKPIGLASGASPEIMPFRRQSGTRGAVQSGVPRNKTFSRGQDPDRKSKLTEHFTPTAPGR
jgi:hypothetical protein